MPYSNFFDDSSSSKRETKKNVKTAYGYFLGGANSSKRETEKSVNTYSNFPTGASSSRDREETNFTVKQKTDTSLLSYTYPIPSNASFDMTLSNISAEQLSRFIKACVPSFTFDHKNKDKPDYFDCLVKQIQAYLDKSPKTKKEFFSKLYEDYSQVTLEKIKKLPTFHHIIIFAFLKKRFFIKEEDDGILFSLITNPDNSFESIMDTCKKTRKESFINNSSVVDEKELIKRLYISASYMLSALNSDHPIREDILKVTSFFEQYEQKQDNYYYRFHKILKELDTIIHADDKEKSSFILKCFECTKETASELSQWIIGDIVLFGFVKKTFSCINEEALMRIVEKNKSKPYLALFKACEEYNSQQLYKNQISSFSSKRV